SPSPPLKACARAGIGTTWKGTEHRLPAHDLPCPKENYLPEHRPIHAEKTTKEPNSLNKINDRTQQSKYLFHNISK
ncbi:hypothetical protein, partial [Acinetobacter baumannii]|uniref:hypothetical protein n=1 Tax=Acinetobacter baumannii TaxID=470 RepID=UPI0037CF03DF